MSIISLSIPVYSKNSKPTFEMEAALRNAGHGRIAGIDEAGRGCLAGPVVAATVVLDPARIPDGLNDSKKLSEVRRRKLFHEIVRVADVGVGIASASEIDRINILQATFIAMTRSAAALKAPADFHLIDGDRMPTGLAGRALPVIKGDALCLSIAAASIVAKVTRDRIMEIAGMAWPHYGFEKHAGYGTQAHVDSVRANGPCGLHRMTFAPLKHEFPVNIVHESRLST